MQLGGGIEFADHREYTPGDDFRYLDWNLYARHDELLLKRFQEEEDLHVYFLLDCSRSMGFRRPPKFDLRPAGDGGPGLHRPGRPGPHLRHRLRRRHRGRLPAHPRQGPHPVALKFLENLEPQGSDTDLAQAVGRASSTATQRRAWPSSSATCSTPAAIERGLDLLRHRRYEPHVIQVHDPSEAEPDCSATWSSTTSTTRSSQGDGDGEQPAAVPPTVRRTSTSRSAATAATTAWAARRRRTKIPFDELSCG